VEVLGVGVDAITMAEAVATIAGWIAAGDRQFVCAVPAHTVMDCRADPALRAMVNGAGLNTPDGMSLVWLLRRRGRPAVERVYGPDLLLAVCERSLGPGWRHLFLGGEEGVAAQLAAVLARRFPGLAVAAALCPPFRPPTPDEDAALVGQINAARPDVVWVGLGSPKQERWMAEHRARLDAPVLVGVGAAFDFLTGRKRQAPRWVQRSGLEWLHRLASEPARLWPRYARYPLFAALVALESAKRAGTRRRNVEKGAEQR
jgi:N-acetylglucosaminyldiphosphoundecaprenol N-acetyl-beta-D-mannosaminyltransferase